MLNGSDTGANLRTILQVLSTALLGILTWLTYNVYTQQSILREGQSSMAKDIAVIQYRLDQYTIDIREFRYYHRNDQPPTK